MGQNIIARIQQLVAKADSTDSMAEAETIMVMVRKLLDAHGISLLEVAKFANDYDPVGTTNNIYGFWAADNWMRKLSSAAGKFYGVEVVWTKTASQKNYTQIAVIGRESCRAAYAAMMPYLRGQVRRLASRGWMHYHYSSESKGRTQIGVALANRLYALAAEKEREARVPGITGSGMNMLVPVDMIAVVQREAFPDLKLVSLKTKARPNMHAVRAAATINLADQLRKEGAPALVIEKS